MSPIDTHNTLRTYQINTYVYKKHLHMKVKKKKLQTYAKKCEVCVNCQPFR